MKKSFLWIFLLFAFSLSVFADPDDDLFGGSSDDELFGGFGGDDDFFVDDGIEEYTDVSAKSDLSKGVIFQNGSIKIGGNLSAGISTSTILYADDTKTDDDGNEVPKTFGDHIHETTLSPELSAYLTVDARPTETLRMYTKFGFAYPFRSTIALNPLSLAAQPSIFDNFRYGGTPDFSKIISNVDIKFTDYLKLKELFTDFSIFDRAFFRFGIHTVTWGAGYFFSPVSDMINTSSIDPENPTAQVDGSLNLRTQITFPGTQNCLWFYIIPSTNFINQNSTDSYLRDTALAGKADILLGNWELGVGGYWRYQNAPKAMLTATGAIKKISLFGEFVYRYGADSEWADNKEWNDKTSIFQVTAGFMYMWSKQNITLAAQYYYDSNNKDEAHQYFTYGHNIAAMANFGKIFGTTDFSAMVFTMVNFGKEDFSDEYKDMMNRMGTSFSVPSFTSSAMMYYSPFSVLKFGLGPSVSWKFDEKPVVSLKLTATLGGGRF